MSNWWANKLGTPAQQQPDMTPPPRPTYQPRLPQHVPTPSPTQASRVTADNLAEMTQQWRGGQATKTQTTPCPECGGGTYMSNPPGSPARCMACGYHDRFQMQGAPPQ